MQSTPLLLHLVVVSSSIILSIAAYVVYQCFLSPLARIPGPFLAKLTNLYRAGQTLRGHSHRDYVALHEKYGKVVRIAPNVLSITDPSGFREIYKAGNKFIKSASYNVMQGPCPFDLVGERDEQVHSSQRKLVARAYATESLLHLEQNVDDVIRSLLAKLDGLRDQKIDLGEWLQLFAFDVVGSISFSRPFGFVESGDDQGLFLRIQNTIASLAWLMHVPWVYHLHAMLRPVIGNWLAVTDKDGFFYEYAAKETVGRKDRGGDDRDMLGQLLTAQSEKSQLRDADINFMMTTNVMAGSDTTSISLRGIFYLLLTHPEKLQCLMAELETQKGAGQLSDIVSAAQAKACPYLQAVIYEGMRLMPPVASVIDRDVPAGGMTIGPYFIPAGTVVGTTAWALHRVPEIWGPDANEFRPERWLDAKAESNLKRFFFAFGGGSRTCIGRNISWIEMEKLIPTLLMRYKMRKAEGMKLLEDSSSLVLIKGLEVRLSA